LPLAEKEKGRRIGLSGMLTEHCEEQHCVCQHIHHSIKKLTETVAGAGSSSVISPSSLWMSYDDFFSK
jgi:hypothetical protein